MDKDIAQITGAGYLSRRSQKYQFNLVTGSLRGDFMKQKCGEKTVAMYELCNQNIECGRPDEETNFVISKVTFKEKIFSADPLF